MRFLILLIAYIFIISFNAYSYGEKFGIGVVVSSKDKEMGKRFAGLIQDQIALFRDHYPSKEEVEAMVKMGKEKQRIVYRNDIYKTDISLSENEISDYRVGKDESDLLRKKLDILKDLKLEIEYPVVDQIWLIETNTMLSQEFNEDLPYIYTKDIFWIYGTLTEVKAKKFYYEFSIFNRLTGENSFLTKGFMIPSEINKAAESIIKNGKEKIIGKPWASLKLNNLPSRAKINLNGQPIELLSDLIQLEPKFYILEVIVNGFKPFTTSFEIKAQQEKTVNIVLKPIASFFYTVKSLPDTADIFVDGNFVGRTPMKIKASVGQIMSLNKDKYKTVFYNLNKETFLNFRLEEFAVKTKKSKERKTLEGTMATFALSLILPIVFFSMATNQDNAGNHYLLNGDKKNADEAYAMKKNLNIAGGISAAMSTVLLGSSIYAIYDYVQSVDPDAKARSADTKEDVKFRKQLKKERKAKEKKEKEDAKLREKDMERWQKEQGLEVK